MKTARSSCSSATCLGSAYHVGFSLDADEEDFTAHHVIMKWRRTDTPFSIVEPGGQIHQSVRDEPELAWTKSCFETVHSRRNVRMATFLVPLRDRCSFGLFPWLISQALSVTYMAVERRLYLERNCRLPESPAHSRRRNREGPASSQGLNSQRGFGPAVEPRRKSRPRSTSLHGSSPCKCQRLSNLAVGPAAAEQALH